MPDDISDKLDVSPEFDAEDSVAQSPEDIEQLTAFDKRARGVAGTPKEEVEKAARREKKRRQSNGMK